MQVEIYPRRFRGFRIPDKEQRSNAPLRGELVIEHRWISKTQTKPAAALREANNSRPDAVIAVLYDPSVKAMRGSGMMICGWEVVDWGTDGKQLVFQEWSCEFTGY